MNKSYIKRQIGEYLLKNGINPLKPFRCLNPTHPDNHPSMNLDKTRNKAHCFSCGADYDIFDLIGIDLNLTNSKDIFDEAEKMFVIKSEKLYTGSKITNGEYNNFFLKAEKALAESFEAKEYLTFRGVSEEVAKLYHIGYCREWKSPKALSEGKNPPPSPRIIIPTGSASYIARDINPNGDKRFRTVKEGPTMLFNADALYQSEPVYIVEGEFDALGILSVGKTAISLGGIRNYRKLLEMCTKRKPTARLILSLDNDEAGIRAQCDIAEVLKKNNIFFEEKNISGRYKDPNEHLQNSPESFRIALEYDNFSEKTQYVDDERSAYNKMGAVAQLEMLLTDIENNRDHPPISTGFTKIDEAFNGGLPPSLIVVGAISSLGKTAYVMQLADQMACSGRDVLVFTIEMSSKELISRSLSRIAQEASLSVLNQRKTPEMISPGVTPGARCTHYSVQGNHTVGGAVELYRDLYAPRLRFIEEKDGEIVSCRRIREDVYRHISITGNKPIVIIDYIQLLGPDGFHGSDKQNIDRNVKHLKQISRDFDIPLIAISSLNRQNYNAPVNMEAFKESGGLEYSADILIGMQLRGVGTSGFNVNAAKAADPREIELVILKNRSGAVGIVIPYRYYAKYNLFIEESEIYKNEIVSGKSYGKNRKYIP